MGSPGLTFGPFTFDPNRRLLKRDGIELALPPRVLGVLEVLLHRAGDVVPRQELIDSVWKDAFVTDTSLAEAVSVLRQTLGDDPQSPAYIQTLHRRGYRFVAPLQKVAGTFSEKVPATFSDGGGSEGGFSDRARVEPSIGGQLLPWSIAAICLILATVAVREAVRDRAAAVPPVTRLTVAPAPGTRFDMRAPALALSPDASRAAWSGCDDSGCRLYVRESDRLDAAAIAGTDGAAAPFFSPDGRWVGFFADGRLKKVALTGGAPVTLADAADPLGAVWTESQGIIFAGAAAGLTAVPGTGGEAIVLTTPRARDAETRHVWPAYHQRGDLLLFTISVIPEMHASGRLAGLTLRRPGSGWTTLIGGVDRVTAVTDDILVFSHGSDLQAVGFDVRRTAITGTPRTVLSDLAVAGGVGQFTAAPAGALLTLSAATSDRRSLYFWTPGSAELESHATEQVARVRDLESLSLSPDGRRIAGIDRTEPARPDIWIADLDRGTASRLTHEGVNVSPVWSHDGASLLYASSAGGPFAIYRRDAEALRPVTELHRGVEHAIPCSISADGSQLAFVSRGTGTRADVWVLPLNGGPARPLIRSPFDDVAAEFSPDGRLVAYQSNDSGRWEIYIHRQADARRVPVSADGGTNPFWSTDGRGLFFRSRDRLVRAAVASDGSSVGAPQIVKALDGALPVGTDARDRLLFQHRSSTPADAAVLTLEWPRELRQILGPPSTVMPR